MHWQWGFRLPKILKNAKKANVWSPLAKNRFLQQDIEVSIVKKMSKTVHLCHDYDSIKCQITNTNTGSASFDKTVRSLCCSQSDCLRTKMNWKKQWLFYNALQTHLDLLRNLGTLLCKTRCNAKIRGFSWGSISWVKSINSYTSFNHLSDIWKPNGLVIVHWPRGVLISKQLIIGVQHHLNNIVLYI